MSIKDIARLAGVSPSTVSRVLNDREYERDEIRKRVLEVVKENGYVPNNVARSMVLRRTFTIGVIIPDTFNMFQRQLFSTIEHRLEQFGYRTMFFFVKWNSESESDCLRRLKSESLDGVIMLHEVQYQAMYKYLNEFPNPVVLCTFGCEHYDFPAVYVDETGAARDAVEYLIQHGHEHIGLIAGAHFSFSNLRSKSYVDALKAHGIEPRSEWQVIVPSYTPEDGRLGMKTLLGRDSSLSAVFAITDELAIGALRALHEAKIRVPDDISVIGFDDIDISGYVEPALTTIHQPIVEMGERTAELVCTLIAEGKGEHLKVVLPHRLVERESVANANHLQF